MKQLQFLIILLAMAAGPPACADYTRPPQDPMDGKAILITVNCECRIGDSPVDSKGSYQWLQENDRTKWKKCNNLIRLKGKNESDFIWYRCAIPDRDWKDPGLLVLARAVEYAELHIGHKKIYAFGEGAMNPQGSNSAAFWHMIPLQGHPDSPDLFIRIHSSLHLAGLYGKIYIGESPYLFRNFVLSDVYKIGLVFLYLFVSIFSLCVYIARRDRVEYLAFSIFIIAMAMLIYEISMSAQLLFSLPFHHWKIWALSTLVGSPSMIAFLEYTLASRYRTLFRRLWQILSIYGISAVIADLLHLVHLYYTVIALMLITVPLSAIIYIIVIRESLRGDRASRIFFAGLNIFLIFLVVDYVRFLSRIHLSNPPIAAGTFAIIMAMGIILIMKFSRTYLDLQDLTVNLGKKVEERTEELRTANRLLEKNDEEKTSFFTNLAHEIKTPLTLIVNSLRAYMKKHGTGPELDSVSRNLDLLLRDINNFFDIMKWEKGIEVYRHDRFVDLSEFIRKKIQLFRSTATARNIQVDASIEDGIIVKADATALDRLLNNLLDNALKYNDEGGSITVAAVISGKEIQLTVRDTGAGICANDRQAIFLPYHRLSQTLHRAGGTGMGLAIVKNIVESLRGTIRVEDNHPRGACFIVTLPAVTCGAVSAGGPALVPEVSPCLPYFHGTTNAPEESARWSGLPPILVVEDNRELVDLMKQELSPHFRVHIAGDGREAMEKIKAVHRPALIISDIMMEGMDGFELLAEIRKNGQFADIPFLFLTARNLTEDRIRAHELGALDYIYKPFYMEELIAKINSIIQFQRVKKELSDKAKFTSLGMLLAGISHEIFNPLSGITGPVTLLKDRMGVLDESSKKYFRTIEESVARIEAIIKNLKDLYGTGDLPLADVRVRPVIDRTWEETRRKTNKDISMNITVVEECHVRTHEFSLAQIFSNLFRNSIDAIESEGTITVKVTEGEGQFRITVEDDGCGINAGDMDRIFDPFFTSKPKSNMGIGLFIVKNLAERMRWQVQVDSETGGGTRVSLVAAP